MLILSLHYVFTFCSTVSVSQNWGIFKGSRRSLDWGQGCSWSTWERIKAHPCAKLLPETINILISNIYYIKNAVKLYCESSRFLPKFWEHLGHSCYCRPTPGDTGSWGTEPIGLIDECWQRGAWGISWSTVLMSI